MLSRDFPQNHALGYSVAGCVGKLTEQSWISITSLVDEIVKNVRPASAVQLQEVSLPADRQQPVPS
jgi:hypothetical protein